MARATQRKKQFAGRDKSWMQFNRRVLEEGSGRLQSHSERVKFLSITGSNLDEYVEIRLAGLLQRTEDGHTEPGYDGLPPQESLDVLTAEMHDFVDAQYRCWNDQLLPELREHGVRLLQWPELSGEQCSMAHAYFQREVDPLLTPITIDPAHPFPRVLNRALCLAMLLRAKRRSSGPAVLGVLTVPRALPRFVRLADANGSYDYILLQDLVAQNLAGMYRAARCWPTRLSASRATPISILRKKKRARCWSRFAANSTTGARATRCAWRSSPTRTRRSWTSCG